MTSLGRSCTATSARTTSSGDQTAASCCWTSARPGSTPRAVEGHDGDRQARLRLARGREWQGTVRRTIGPLLAWRCAVSRLRQLRLLTANSFQFPPCETTSGSLAGLPFAHGAAGSDETRRSGSSRPTSSLLALQALTSTADKCSSCGRPIPAGTWRCACGRSLLAPQAWTTLGGDAAHAARPRPSGPSWKLAWTSESGQPIAGRSCRRRRHGRDRWRAGINPGPGGHDGPDLHLGPWPFRRRSGSQV